MRVTRVLAWLAFTACPAPIPVTPDDPPWSPAMESCDAPDPDDPARFRDCTTGSGIFGAWFVDEFGLPAYDYRLDPHADARAAFPNTEGLDRRDHWWAFGNHRVNAWMTNDGFVEVVTQDRGVEHLNKLDPAQESYAGGYSYVDDGEAVWSTAYRFRPRPSATRRRFGMGWAESAVTHRGIEVAHALVAPWGDAPFVVDEVTLKNHGGGPRTLRHYEFWDVGRRSVEINWAVSGDLAAGVPRDAAAARDERNAMFDERVVWEPGARVLALRRAHAEGVDAPPADRASTVDYYPPDPLLVALDGDVHDVYTTHAGFFGGGGGDAPATVVGRREGEGLAAGVKGEVTSGESQPRLLVMRTDLVLQPGETRRLRFAYGYTPFGTTAQVPAEWNDPALDLRRAFADALRPLLMLFAAPGEPVLHRELAWHAWQIEASAGRRDFFGQHVVPQGSAYLYLHGADGAARDLGLFAVPLVYTHPELAREELELFMKITHAEGRRFSYAFHGHGMLDDALGFHRAPSDLTLFFLWAVSEYVGATGDVAWLSKPVPYYPPGAIPDAPVRTHVEDAVRHLFDVVGTGPHGLVRVQTGDWSDGIVFEAPDRALAVASGESVPNTQMAVAVLPRAADLVATWNAALAAEMRERVAALRAALPVAWAGAFYGRAYFGDGVLRHADTVNLEAQVWALIGDETASAGDRAALLARIAADLDDPSPAGAPLVPGGQVWPAVSALLTWGYALHDGGRAWRHLARNTMAAHAQAFPSVWYGIWSGPDGAESTTGLAWSSPVTPMKDFPVQNNNQHAMPLLAALRVAGVDATADGLRIRPADPDRELVMATRTIELRTATGVLRGRYFPTGNAARRVVVDLPGKTILSVTVNGAPVTQPEFDASAGAETRFEITFRNATSGD